MPNYHDYNNNKIKLSCTLEVMTSTIISTYSHKLQLMRFDDTQKAGEAAYCCQKNIFPCKDLLDDQSVMLDYIGIGYTWH